MGLRMPPSPDRRCGQCGAAVPAGQTFCIRCGARSERGTTVLGVLGALILAAVCLIVAVAGACFLVFTPMTGLIGLVIGGALLWLAFTVGKTAWGVATRNSG